MGYLLRGLRIASYLAVVLGLLLIFGAIINNATFFYGIRLLFIGVVGIGGTSLLRDSFIEGTEEEDEYNSLHPPQGIIPQVRTPKTIQSALIKKKVKKTWGGVRRTVLGWGLLVGSVSGFMGVLMGSCAATMTFDWGSPDSGIGYIFGIIIFSGYPFIGAILGGLSGLLISFVFGSVGDKETLSGVGVIASLLFGFVIGVWVGIAPFIGIQWLDKIYWQ